MLYFNVLSTVLRKNPKTDFLHIYIYIYLSIYLSYLTFLVISGVRVFHMLLWLTHVAFDGCQIDPHSQPLHPQW